MPTGTRTLRLGDEALNGARHICALFDGPDIARAVLMPFLLDGLLNGERLVYLTGEPDAVRAAFGAAAAAAAVSGSIEIRPWSDSYLSEPRFGAVRMLGFLRKLLRAGSTRGRDPARLVGEMEWAREDLPGVDELVTYEAGVDAIVDHSPNVVICAYDVRRHNASQIAAVAGVHHAVFVGGRLQRSARVARGSAPRERILASAARLFTEGGIRGSGVDAIIHAAGVAKATFYRHFPSKDDLVVTWLEDPRTRWFERVRGRAEALATSRADLVPAFFRALGEWIEAGDYRGCPYLNTSIEIADPAHPAFEAAQGYLREIEQSLGEVAAEAGCRDPDRIGTELQVLAAGAITLGVSHRSTAFAEDAGRAATEIVRRATEGQRPH